MNIAFCRPRFVFIVQSYGNYRLELFLTFNFVVNVVNSVYEAAGKNFADIAAVASLLSVGKRLHFVRQQAIAWQQDPSLFSFTPHRFAWKNAPQ